MKLFEGCIVKSNSEVVKTAGINGLTVKRTVKWCYTGDPNGTLYEVILSDGKHYQLYEDEMVENK